MPRRGCPVRRPLVPWWSETIAANKSRVHKCHRAYQRKRRCADEGSCAVEAAVFRNSRKELALSIIKAKKKCWAEIIDSVENDLWGRPYKIVMKWLGRRKPATGIQLPGRLENIVRTLFPPAIPDTAPEDIVTPASFPVITIDEVRIAARALSNGKAPSPDGVPNEIVKAAAIRDP